VGDVEGKDEGEMLGKGLGSISMVGEAEERAEGRMLGARLVS